LGLGFALKYSRLKARIKQKELARLIGTSTSHLSLIESEKRPASMDLLVRASGALGIPVEIFLIEAKAQSGELTPKQVELFRQAKELLSLAWRIEADGHQEVKPTGAASAKHPHTTSPVETPQRQARGSRGRRQVHRFSVRGDSYPKKGR
jgi:transcriptional regulator with XRE-family HTH domain